MYAKQNLAVECWTDQQSDHVQHILEEQEGYPEWALESTAKYENPLIVSDDGTQLYFNWNADHNFDKCEQITYKEFLRRFVKPKLNLYL